jgi:phosphoglycolate phosphatase-like HAD superfamily hydrolase
MVGATDPVGAGDSYLAGICASLAAKATPEEAAQVGNFVAGVTVAKLRQTGTASPAEVLQIGLEPQYIYDPELAEDPRQAKFLDGTEIEIIDGRFQPPARRPAAAIFDHDGTISTLRQGWEEVIEPMMVRAILGARFGSADEALYHRVVARVRAHIDQTTGVQTLIQMQGLVGMVREFGLVPATEISDESGYKAIYNQALMARVRQRLQRLVAGELSVQEFTLRNAIPFLQALHWAGVRLYLASGTDQADVEAEARALGYAGLFEGRIYGAVGDVTCEAKRMVLDRILKEVQAMPAQIVTFGDGPVEIRETQRRGGLAIGVASDEVRRFDSNKAKRARLIRAGAAVIIPDFSQMGALVRMLKAG